MVFEIDKQTIKDLELFPEKRKDKSVLSVFSNTATIGGRNLMSEVFSNPRSDYEFLQNRGKEIYFFVSNNCSIKLNSGQLDYIEWYLRNKRSPLKDNVIDAAYDRIKNKISPDTDYFTISEGILHIIRLLVKFKEFIDETSSFLAPPTLENDFNKAMSFIKSKTLKKVLTQSDELSFKQVNQLDYFFRVTNKNDFREFLDIVYKIDITQTLSLLISKEGFNLPEYVPHRNQTFLVEDAINPLLDSPVPNSFIFTDSSNLCFITGPNMSGKSTFLKTMGVLIYLAHLGFPVPARKLKTSVFDGLFTTINLADNLNLGYSHFFSEVKRVRDLVIKMNSGRNLFIIFDELFRGTNVKDAYDASLEIISSLAKIHDNYFFISTHILEVAENLADKSSILFKCFESDLIDQNPVYDFKLKDGISKERIGLLIIKRERIIEILEEIVRKQK